jgi:hypothetical protein
MESSGVAAGQIGAARSANEQRIAGEHAVLDPQAHGIACVARSVHRLHAQISEDQ